MLKHEFTLVHGQVLRLEGCCMIVEPVRREVVTTSKIRDHVCELMAEPRHRVYIVGADSQLPDCHVRAADHDQLHGRVSISEIALG